MMELLFVVCMSTQPDHCQERSLTFVDITATQCMRGAQPELARWITTHPDQTIKSWRCQEVRLGEREA